MDTTKDLYENFDENQDNWLKWGTDIHNDPEQLKRQMRAAGKECTPLSLTTSSGIFRGSKKDYSTDFLSCTCKDFALKKKPCKHMYRLAYELGVYMFDDVVSEKHISEKKQIDDVMPVIFSLPDDLQMKYSKICYSCGNDNKNFKSSSLDNTTAQIFIDKGLLCVVSDKAKLIKHCRTADVKKLLQTLTDSELPSSREEIFDYALSNFPDIELPLSNKRKYCELPDDISHLAITMKRRIDAKFRY